MIKLKYLLSEEKLKPHTKLIIQSVLDFMRNEYNMNAKITVKRNSNGKFIGSVPMNDRSVKQNKFTVHYNPNQSTMFMIKSLIHELTHVKQISNKELQPASDYKSIHWKGTEFITIRDYNKAMKKDPSTYRNLPWEKEAEVNMKKLYTKFINSKYWKSLKGKDKTLDYIMDNL